MANIELVTAHKGSPHITTEQVVALIGGLSGDISGIKIFSQLDNGLVPEITSGTKVTVNTGQALAGGYFFQLLDAYEWELDPGAVGYSRIDDLYVVIYEDTITNVQTADFVYQVGTAFPTGNEGNPPDPPSAVNIKGAYLLIRALMVSGAVDSVEVKGSNYISNSSLQDSVDNVNTRLGTDENNIQANTSAIELCTSKIAALLNPQTESRGWIYDFNGAGEDLELTAPITPSGSNNRVKVYAYTASSRDQGVTVSVEYISLDDSDPTQAVITVRATSLTAGRAVIDADIFYYEWEEPEDDPQP
jgi:hypothetical protein